GGRCEARAVGGGLGQGGEHPQVGGALRVPLDAEGERARRVLDDLDDPVVGAPADRGERTRVVDGLVVERVDAEAGAQQVVRPGAGANHDVMAAVGGGVGGQRV